MRYLAQRDRYDGKEYNIFDVLSQKVVKVGFTAQEATEECARMNQEWQEIKKSYKQKGE